MNTPVARISFDKDEITELAAFVAELVRQGVTFEVHRDKHGAEVTLTGGC